MGDSDKLNGLTPDKWREKWLSGGSTRTPSSEQQAHQQIAVLDVLSMILLDSVSPIEGSPGEHWSSVFIDDMLTAYKLSRQDLKSYMADKSQDSWKETEM